MAADSVIKARLRALRARPEKTAADAAAIRELAAKERDEAAKRRREDLEWRAAGNGITPELQALVDQPNDYQMVDRTMPLAFYYGAGSIDGRDAAFERRRAEFYFFCAKAFGFVGWQLEAYFHEIVIASQAGGGRDGRKLNLLPIDKKQAINLNANAAPLEWLASRNMLESKKDPTNYGMMRLAVALRFRDEMAGAQAGGLKGQDYGGAGSGFGPRLVSDYALDCMASVSAVRSRLHPGLYRLLELVVIDDVWMWDNFADKIDARIRRAIGGREARTAKGRKKLDKLRRRFQKSRRDRTIVKLHKAIDGAAVVFGYMTEQEYRARWVSGVARGTIGK